MAAPGRDITVALLGGGTVGGQVARIICENADELASRVGARMVLTGVAVRDLARERAGIDPTLLTTDAASLAASGADVVVELIGGIEPANSWILSAIGAGSSVVTANKALVAERGQYLHDAAEAAGVDLYYEAAVAGAIPLLRPLADSLAGDRVRRVLGIVNGTTNYILTRMDEEAADYAEVLAEAQRLGFAEADPTADVAGYDAAAKAAILASLAFHTRVTLDDVYREGITDVTAEDVAAAKEMGFVVKLLFVAELTQGGLCVRVHPAMVPRSHPLASVRLAFNAVFVEADAAGEVMFYGQGAGGQPTASAVLGDLVTAARHRVTGSLGAAASTHGDFNLLPVTDATTCFYVNLHVIDQPGVLARIAQKFADHGVSISTVRQDGEGDDARLIIRTHAARDGSLYATLADLRSLPEVRQVVGSMRVIRGPGE
ncbi:MAG: homoserine dehydrogenase [Candidatus Nanopelagicales bacterium]|nr:homoserine dehydrogenase [Candidatus Nanopelagicales bacterium]MDZ4249129.1 homoserine dehydrogenase [Candidatus Nanopelagicales bacterium]